MVFAAECLVSGKVVRKGLEAANMMRAESESQLHTFAPCCTKSRSGTYRDYHCRVASGQHFASNRTVECTASPLASQPPVAA